MSILISGSPRRRRISSSHSSFEVPGSTRQSIVASAIDGMTLTFGGSPTPERRLVTEIVECWIALLNLLSGNVPTRDLNVSTTLNDEDGNGCDSIRASALTRRSFGFRSCG